ncbi:antibiotic biosynthesis monooxygenase [Enterococcus villorum]|uniref:Antibiotic biosynthesis monooxygenase n=1 Tax=Enterococcus villorum TaxID=112904 RepID=A0A1V8Y9K3_9ENTE|nr:putative quinol monooxygenase [Enterococcus villorum]OQO69304.1 antibiotic biosynthesis monooxygenase [Enterococcus villorum]OQO72069.1 antibiotic biosynthesis monooxygenase [Enterococcus villorum]
MIVINAKFTIKSEKRNEFLEEVKQLVESTKKEEGCLGYQLYESIDFENEFVMIENWRDLQAIEGHNQNSLLQKLFKNMSQYGNKKTEINISKTLEE